MRSKGISAIVGAASLAALSAPAQATGTVDTSYGNPQPQEERGFPWGLLGLLGLIGLLPRKRKDHVDVDNRRGTTTTRP